MNIKTAQDAYNQRELHHWTLYEVALHYEMQQNDQDIDTLLGLMSHQWNVMKKAIADGLDENNTHIRGKILDREAYLLKKHFDSETSICGPTTTKAITYALSTMEVNISMGLIVAAPTAGASGVLPGTLRSIQERYDLSDQQIIEGLFVAGIVGVIIAKQASISGAKGGCQAEIGSAASMTAAAVVYLLGGTMNQSFDAAAIAINNTMGLICDPVAGLVEVPCHKRNAMGASNALICAEMVLAGMKSVIPFDEVVIAMKHVGDLLPACHRETATGGIAMTKTAKAYEQKIMGTTL
jgi:L-serine dehydratase